MKLKTIALAVLAIGTSGSVFAAEQVQKVEKIEVTGSNIKRTATETSSPIQIIRAEEIKRTGATTAAELLKLIPATSSGGLDDLGSGSGFSSGVSSASLRGLGSSATLVLLNGRRMSAAAYADPNTGQSTIYNLNNIPLSAVERVEIFKDGASAVYGSDAMAGVINFILRKDYNGLQASVSANGALEGGFQSQMASIVGGFGDIAADRWNLMLAADYRNRQRTGSENTNGIAQDLYKKINDRLNPQWSSASYPGNYYRERTVGSGVFSVLVGADSRCDPAQTGASATAQNGKVCWYNIWPRTDLVADQTSANIFSRGVFKFSESLTAFAEAAYNETKSTYNGVPTGLNGNSPATWFALDGTRKQFTFILPANHPDNPLFQANPANTARVAIRYRFADIPSETEITTKNTRVAVGLEGSNFDWDWKAGLLYNKAERITNDKGRILAKELQEAIDNRTYRPGGNNSADVIAKISPTRTDKGETSVVIADLKGSTELGELAGGTIGIAAGIEARREEIDIVPDARLQRAEFIGLGSSMAKGNRNVQSLFAEVSLPVLKQLTIDAAARYDHYSDYGNSTTPKIGLKWNPTDSFSVRGTYAEGFRAPGLTQITSSSVQSFNSGIIDPLRCSDLVDPASRSSTTECSSGISLSSRISANPELQPEKSKSYTFGFVFAPTNNFNGSLDLYEIRRRDEIDRLSSQYIINQVYRFGNQKYADQIIRSSSPETWVRYGTGSNVPAELRGQLVPNSGIITSTIRKFFNLGESRVKGVDLDLNLRNKLGEYGRLSTNLNLTYLLSYKQAQFKGDDFVEYAGGYGPAGELPRLKGSVSTTWQKGAWSTTGRVNYTGGWFYGDNGECGVATSNTAYYQNFPDCKISAWTTVDLGLAYLGIKNLTLAGTVRNIFNNKAPYDPDNVGLGFNDSFHNPYGRYLSLRAEYKFF